MCATSPHAGEGTVSNAGDAVMLVTRTMPHQPALISLSRQSLPFCVGPGIASASHLSQIQLPFVNCE